MHLFMREEIIIYAIISHFSCLILRPSCLIFRAPRCITEFSAAKADTVNKTYDAFLMYSANFAFSDKDLLPPNSACASVYSF
jgi:hypothetical protein